MSLSQQETDPKQEVESAYVWGLSNLVSVLGEERGLEVFESLDPRKVLLLWMMINKNSENEFC